jgi:hypothetical protein
MFRTIGPGISNLEEAHDGDHHRRAVDHRTGMVYCRMRRKAPATGYGIAVVAMFEYPLSTLSESTDVAA